MIEVFIDESGNLGRGGRYFVLAAAVFDTPQGRKRAARVIRNFQGKAMKEDGMLRKEVKSNALSLPKRQKILNKLIAKADLDIFYLAVDKHRVALLQAGKPKNLVYNYFAKLLTDKIFSKYNDDYRVIFDQRTTAVKSMNSLTEYITINAYTTHGHIHHDILVQQRDSKTENNLQVADVIAGTVYQAYNFQNKHFLSILKERIVSADEFPRGTFTSGLASSL